MHWVVLPEDLGALGHAANRQYLIVERIPLQRERLVELDRLQAPEPKVEWLISIPVMYNPRANGVNTTERPSPL